MEGEGPISLEETLAAEVKKTAVGGQAEKLPVAGPVLKRALLGCAPSWIGGVSGRGKEASRRSA